MYTKNVIYDIITKRGDFVKIYIFDIKKLNNEDIAICQNHFPKRYEKAQSFHFDDDKKRAYAGAVLIHKILGINENDIKYGENGKPLCDNICFNISHSGDFVILGSSENPIGVDIEKTSDYHEKVAKRVFTDNEQKWLEDDKKNRFYQLWTLKESVMKATGKGLQLTPNSFEVLPFFENKPIIIDHTSYYGMSVKFKDYYISVCKTEPIKNICIEEFV